MPGPGAIAVLDVGKSNIKLSACSVRGDVLETLSSPNPVLPGPPWSHHDLTSVNHWVLDGLGTLARRHPLRHFVAAGHGSGGMLVGDDPDAGGDGTVLPMIDYEQSLPAGIGEAYAGEAGSFFDRGCAIMMAATHTARQMFWAERVRPADFARARWVLGIPQYWAWRLSGVPVGEVTILGAQSQLWNVPERRWAPIVAAHGWQRLMPPMAPAWSDLGEVRPDLARRHGLPADLRIHAGVHDSSANYYCYQSAGMTGVCVVSTGTWIVAMADSVALSRLDEALGMTCNADVAGRPLCGALTMGGREYGAVAGAQPDGVRADPGVLAQLVERGTMALPTFGSDDGQFPASAGCGRISGPPPTTPRERHALAVLYAALLTVTCADTLDPGRPLVLDGSFLRDPAFAALVAALRPGREVLVNRHGYGVASGAARLCAHGDGNVQPLPFDLTVANPLPGLADLTHYAARWRELAKGMTR